MPSSRPVCFFCRSPSPGPAWNRGGKWTHVHRLPGNGGRGGNEGAADASAHQQPRSLGIASQRSSPRPSAGRPSNRSPRRLLWRNGFGSSRGQSGPRPGGRHPARGRPKPPDRNPRLPGRPNSSPRQVARRRQFLPRDNRRPHGDHPAEDFGRLGQRAKGFVATMPGAKSAVANAWMNCENRATPFSVNGRSKSANQGPRRNAAAWRNDVENHGTPLGRACRPAGGHYGALIAAKGCTEDIARRVK